MNSDKYLIPHNELEINFERFFSQNKNLESHSGMSRVVEALDLGLNLKHKGYNIFVAGEAGTGRTTVVREKVEEVRKKYPPAPDLCYVFNFENPDVPTLITLKKGMGKKFKNDVETLANRLINQIRRLFDQKFFKNKQEAIFREIKTKQAFLLKNFQDQLSSENFTLVQISDDDKKNEDMDIFPLINGKPVSLDELDEMVEKGEISQKDFENIQIKYFEFIELLNQIMIEIDDMEKDIEEKVTQLYVATLEPFLRKKFDVIRKNYKIKKITTYFNSLIKFILMNLEVLIIVPTNEMEREQIEKLRSDFFKCFQVNLLVDNSSNEYAPLVIENSPTYRNLFGTIEQKKEEASDFIDVRAIKPGSLLKANGGFLILYAADIFNDVAIWNHLVRVLKSGTLQIQNQENFYANQTSLIKPETIDIDLKVIIIGTNTQYDILYNLDPDFRRIFKVKAEFDTEMEYNGKIIEEYKNYLKKIAKEDKMLSFSECGLNEIIKYSIKLSGNKKKISTKFSDINDILREANFWAQKKNAKVINSEFVKIAIEKRNNRLRLYEEKIREMFKENTYIIDFTDKKIGMINGLTVFDYGDYSFGKPVRITAQVGIGEEGILSVEREVDLSGSIHDKGVLIITGYLRGHYGRFVPLNICATVCFEQSYNEIDGDSASAAELCAILSSLSRIPLKQNIAITGSINQYGEIQPIGGVTEKISGFYLSAEYKGITNNLGVIVPAKNIYDIMLDDYIMDKVKKGDLKIYAVEKFSDVIEIMTDMDFGIPDEEGNYPEGSFNYFVMKELKRFAKIYKESNLEK